MCARGCRLLSSLSIAAAAKLSNLPRLLFASVMCTWRLKRISHVTDPLALIDMNIIGTWIKS